VGSEDLLADGLGNAVGKGELEVLGEELLDVGAADVLGLLNLDDLDDVDRTEAGTVAGGHVLVEGIDGLAARHLAVLLVHVVGTGARVVTDPDTEVLDLLGALLMNLVEGDDLAVCLLDLSQLRQEVPESALGDDLVGSEDAHAVELGGGVGLGGQQTANDLVFLEASCTAVLY